MVDAGSSSASSPNPLSSEPQVTQEETLSDEELQAGLQDAEDLKREGNEHFRNKRWNEALASYRSGLGHLPKRKVRSPPSPRGRDKSSVNEPDEDEDARHAKDKSRDAEHHDTPSPPNEPEPSALDLECVKARATLNANIGACYVKLGEHKEVVSACTEALADDPEYVKALQRRASSNEELNTWTSLSSAQEDYNKLLELLPTSSPQRTEIRRTLQALKPRLEAAQKRETAEMMDKLKGLGNSILGNFGLSTDNFQFTPNGEGGYSMNFVR